MHFIAFDTNIYREFGISFTKNIDFSYLSKFLEKGPHELFLLDIVYEELMDYFREDYVGKLIKDYENVYQRFESNEFIENIELENLTILEQNAINNFKKTLIESCWKVIHTDYVETQILTDFLIYNKRNSKKDNTRDFLIWLSLIQLAKKYPEGKIIFISRDKIFTENIFFLNLIKSKSIKNIEVIESVSNYLSDYGLQIYFLTNDLVLKTINKDIILSELKKGIADFPSYITEFYHSEKNKPPKNISIEILDVEVNDYYTYSEEKKNTILVSSFLVRVKAVFAKETRVDLKELIPEFYYEEIKHRVDSENRPIYENYVLFIFESDIDSKSKKIMNHRFIDFIIDWNIKN
ncbi:MAG: DUF4935 domain-containing protein [Bacteroidetes bacterium]|nr:DUF4935 domain-containing protein [Bacteroidota bacterium]